MDKRKRPALGRAFALTATRLTTGRQVSRVQQVQRPVQVQQLPEQQLVWRLQAWLVPWRLV